MKIRRALSFAATAIIGIVLGAVGMYMFSVNFHSYGNTARFLADATADVAALEKLAANQTGDAQEILRVRLRGSMIALRADPEHQTAEQQAMVKAIETRAAPFVSNP